MNKSFAELPGWSFHLDEVSAEVYEVIGTDGLGHRVASKGIDLDEVVKECREAAKRIAGGTN